jgi:hypothetical protein
MAVKTVSMFALPDEYQRQASEARRRRRMAEMLAQQAYQPGDIQNAPIPRGAPLVQGLQAFLAARGERKAEEAEESAMKAQTREARDFLRALTEPAKTMTIGEAAMQDIAQAGTPELVDGRLEYRKTAMPAPTPEMVPQAGPQVRLGRRPEDDQVYMPTATGRETDPQRMAAMLANPQYKAEFTPEQKRALALEGVLTSQNPLVQKIGQMQYAAMQPKQLEVGAIDPGDYTPESFTNYLNTGNFGVLKPREQPIAAPKTAAQDTLQWNPKTQKWEDIPGAVTRIRDIAEARRIVVNTGGGGGGGGRGQQGPAFVLANGKVVQSTFDPSTGQYMYQSDTGRVPIPADAKPTTASAASGLSEKQYITYRQEAFDHQQGLKRLNSFFEKIGDTNVGIQRWADAVAVKAKSLLGNPLSREQLALELAKGEQQGLLGLFRVDIVGPGVLTEYDAGRVIEALGGDLNALQNKEKVFALLQQLYQDKMDRFEFLNQELGRSDLVRGGKPMTAEGLPSTLGSPNKVEEVDY